MRCLILLHGVLNLRRVSQFARTRLPQIRRIPTAQFISLVAVELQRVLSIRIVARVLLTWDALISIHFSFLIYELDNVYIFSNIITICWQI